MEKNPFDLTGKVAAVSGAGRGIGKAIALALARAGADLVVFSRTEEQFIKTAAEIEALGREALGLQVNVTKPEHVKTMMEATLDKFGRLDVMVNNAGVNASYALTEDVTEKHWDLIMRVNLKGAFLCSKEAIPVMKAQGKGCIINVSSTGGLVALYKCSAYCASKGGVIQLTKTMALELAPHNIRVNAIAPGFVHTYMTEDLLSDPDEQERIISKIPMGRTGELEEIAPAAVYLASDAASYITGSVVCVDGGYSTW